jgi:hypothetical protein
MIEYIMCILFIFLILYYLYNTSNEHYQSIPQYANNQIWNPRWISNFDVYDGISIQDSKITSDCYSLDKNQCLRTSNCGLCHNNYNNKMECVPGDEDGPLFKDNCEKWIYTNNYDRFIYGNKIIDIVDPTTKLCNEQYPGLPTSWARSTI